MTEETDIAFGSALLYWKPELMYLCLFYSADSKTEGHLGYVE